MVAWISQKMILLAFMKAPELAIIDGPEESC
jgi:hypothetical protein